MFNGELFLIPASHETVLLENISYVARALNGTDIHILEDELESGHTSGTRY